jgi:hypothetical protein
MLDLNVAVTQVAKHNAADRTARGIPGEPECVCSPQIYPFDPHA